MRDKITEFFRQVYDYELQKTERLNRNFQFLSTLYTILGGVVVYYAGIFEKPIWTFRSIWFFISFFLGILFLAISLRYFIPSFWARKYMYIAKANELHGWLSENSKTFKSDIERLHSVFIENIEKQYANAADHNQKINIVRSDLNRKALRYILWSILCLILAFPGHLFIKATLPEEVINKSVVTPILAKMSEEDSDQQAPPPTTPDPEPQTTPFPDPQFIEESLANSRDFDPPPPPPPPPKED